MPQVHGYAEDLPEPSTTEHLSYSHFVADVQVPPFKHVFAPQVHESETLTPFAHSAYSHFPSLHFPPFVHVSLPQVHSLSVAAVPSVDVHLSAVLAASTVAGE